MTARDATRQLTIVFDARLPSARWGPLFHVFRLEHPDLRLEWQAAGFPIRGRPLLDGADAGLFVEPPREEGRSALTLDVSPMVVIVAAGDRLARRTELRVVDILDRPFPGGTNLNPEWTSFWTLDEQRGGPPTCTADDVRSAEDGLEVIAAGRAIGTLPAWMADGLAHPGVIALPLCDGPQVRTRLVCHSHPDNPIVDALLDLVTAWTRDGRRTPTRP
ncbi:LysR family transcriptional regulator substrate-binding protein [Solirubrobacter soli]|uniref:LysR family transcriptional regulator substrate-binding protein n=1 Tax=Solirubrobacter soli TaxID=363832 RepID=UPI0004837818|nr:LysR family transcriptional regulator substrate-binding protein [Solirubrobacter soli]